MDLWRHPISLDATRVWFVYLIWKKNGDFFFFNLKWSIDWIKKLHKLKKNNKEKKNAANQFFCFYFNLALPFKSFRKTDKQSKITSLLLFLCNMDPPRRSKRPVKRKIFDLEPEENISTDDEFIPEPENKPSKGKGSKGKKKMVKKTSQPAKP